MPMSRGIASGQSSSNSPRVAPGRCRAARRSPNAPARASGSDRGRRAGTDPEVLRQVARVLDAPSPGCSRGLVAVGLLLVLVVVARVEDVAGRGHVVGEQQGHRDRRADARRDGAARPRAAAADEHEERRAEHDREARRARDPNSRPASSCRRSSSSNGCRSASASDRAGAGRASGRPRPRRRHPDRRRARRRPRAARNVERDDVREEPGRAELRRVPEHGAEGEEDRRREPDRGGTTARRPSAHQASPTSTAPSSTETARMSVARPQMATNGRSSDGGQRRERKEGARRRWVPGQLAQGVDILHPVVATREPAGSTGQSIDGACRAGRPCACHTKWL